MAIKSEKLNTSRTIRDFLNENLVEGVVVALNEITPPAGGAIQDIDVIWDGSNYYIAYRTTAGGAITIADLDSVLPITITPKTDTTA